MPFQLHIKIDGQPGETILPLGDGDHLVGRSRSAEIHLTEPDVSGKHLILHVDGDSVIAENLSSHGARTGRVTLELPTPIKPGDSIYLGSKTVLSLTKYGDADADEAPEKLDVTMVGVSASPSPQEAEVEEKPSVATGEAAVTSAPGDALKTEVPGAGSAPAAGFEATVIGTPGDALKTEVSGADPAPAAGFEATVIGTPGDALKTEVSGADSAPAAGFEATVIGTPGDALKTEVPGADSAPAAGFEATVIGTPDDALKTEVPGADFAPAADCAATVVESPSAVSAENAGEAKGEDEVFKTNVMQTRLASAEELEFLRRQDRASKRGKKLKYVLPLIGAAVLLGLVFFLKGTQPEEKLTWPKTPGGKLSEEPCNLGDGGHAAGRFSLIVPKVQETEKSVASDGSLVIMTRVGRDHDVPLRLMLSSKRSPAFLRETRETTFRNWMKEISAGSDHWNFDQISDLFFLGRDNGLPCMSAVYTREVDHQSWYGEVLFFRNGDERVIRMAEIPSSERLRGADFLSGNSFLFTSPKFVEDHWEGAETIIAGDPAELLLEAKGLLVKMSPATWDKITLLLRSTLVQAQESKNDNLKEEAILQLRKLRETQKVWYNAQCLAYLKEKNSGNLRGAELIRNSCLAVFASADDLRNLKIQRNIWE